MQRIEAGSPLQNRYVWVVAFLGGVLAVFVRWYFVAHAQVLQPVNEAGEWGDAAEYYRYAWNLVHHRMFSADLAGMAHPTSDSFRDPGYPAFLAFLMAVTSSYQQWYGVVILSQVLIGGLTVTFATLAIRHAVPLWLLALAALLMALWPHLVTISAYILSENLSGLLCALSALLLCEAVRRNATGYIFFAGLTLAAAALTNAVAAPLVMPLVIVFAWKRTMSRQHMALLIAVTALPLFAWGIRNSVISTETSSSYRAEINLVQGSWPTYHAATRLWARHDPIGVQTIDAINKEIAVIHGDRLRGLGLMAERMSTAPASYLAWYVRKPALLWGWTIELGAGDIYVYPTRHSPFVTMLPLRIVEAIAFAFNDILALLAVAGVIIVSTRPSPNAALVTFAVTCAWATLVYALLQSDARYAIPFRTGEIALASVAVAQAVAYMQRRRSPVSPNVQPSQAS